MESILDYKHCEDEDYYKVLGCDETANTDQIIAEFRALSLLYHPDKNPNNEDAALRFQKILRAKEILADPAKRAIYDKWYRSGFSVPFEQFLNLNKAAHTSIHWVSKKKKDLMIEGECSFNRKCEPTLNEWAPTSDICRNVAWERDPACKLLQKFRNYEI